MAAAPLPDRPADRARGDRPGGARRRAARPGARADLRAAFAQPDEDVDRSGPGPRERAGRRRRHGTGCTAARRWRCTKVPPSADATHLPEAIALAVVHEDADLVVLDKPAGLVVHPGSGNRDGTLLNALLHHAPELATLPRAGIVHRLDKDTSGLMVVARTLPAHTDLVRQLAARTVKREYLALVHGDLARATTIDAPIGRHPTQRTSMAVVEGGKAARTHVDVLERFGAATLVRCRLETGRTHQIRVHLTALGHPLLGDPTYRGKRRAGSARCRPRRSRSRGRRCTRSAWASCTRPRGKAMQWEAAPPADFAALLAALRAHRARAGVNARDASRRARRARSRSCPPGAARPRARAVHDARGRPVHRGRRLARSRPRPAAGGRARWRRGREPPAPARVAAGRSGVAASGARHARRDARSRRRGAGAGRPARGGRRGDPRSATSCSPCAPPTACPCCSRIARARSSRWRMRAGAVSRPACWRRRWPRWTCAPGDAVAWLGPAIGPTAFEVGRDVYDALLRARSGRRGVLRAAARRQVARRSRRTRAAAPGRARRARRRGARRLHVLANRRATSPTGATAPRAGWRWPRGSRPRSPAPATSRRAPFSRSWRPTP